MMLPNWRIVVCVIVVVIGLLINTCTPVPVWSLDENTVQIKLLSQDWNPDPRVKRAISPNLPDHLSFGIPVRRDGVVLKLKRSRLLPTVTSDLKTTATANRVSEGTAVYTDVSTESAVIINRVNDEYSLEGSFVHDGREWNLQPVDSHSGQGMELRHRISPASYSNMAVSFMNDTVLVAEDGPEQNHFPDKQNNLVQEQQQIRNESRGDNNRHKRAITQHVIEVAMVVDYEDYSKWERRFGPEKALPAMRIWYTFVAESMNIRYQTIKDPDIAISTTVKSLKILNRARDSTFLSKMTDSNGKFPGPDGVIAFRKWYPTQRDIPRSDHYMLITGFDIIGSSGIAVSSRTCTGYGVSICENRFTGSLGGVAAHELGHSLSAIHDVDTTGPNSCTDRDQYVMSTAFITPVRADKEGNPWRFSTCSIAAIKTYLSEVVCTLPEHTSGMTELPAPIEGERAGEVLTRDDQCILSFLNSRSSFCEAVQLQNGGLERLCGGMYCSIPHDLQGFCQSIVPQEYTSCGIEKWCITGQCVGIHHETTTIPITWAPTSFLFTVETSTLPLSSFPSTPTQQSTSSLPSTTTLFLEPNTTTSTQTPFNPENCTSGNISTTPSNISTTPSNISTTYSNISTTPSNISTTYSNISTTPSNISTTPSNISTTFEATTSTTPARATTTTIPDGSTPMDYLSRCSYLIFLGKSTQWWECVQREKNCHERRAHAAETRTRFRDQILARARNLWENW